MLLGCNANIKHWLPEPLIQGDMTIMDYASSLYTDSKKLLIINEMRLYLKIIFMMEVEAEMYVHRIKFPEVQYSRSLAHHWNQFKKDLEFNFRQDQFVGKIEHIKWWKQGDLISDGSRTFKHKYASRYAEIPFINIEKCEIVQVKVQKKSLQVINIYEIKEKDEIIPFQLKIEELAQLKHEKSITMYTDAGVHLETGKSACGIIFMAANKEVEVKAQLPTVNPKGATIPEHISVSVGLNLLHKADITTTPLCIINTVNETKSFKALVNKHGWGKYKVWKEVEDFQTVKAEWSGQSSSRSEET